MQRRSLLIAAAVAPVPRVVQAKSADPMAAVLNDRLRVQGVGYAYARIDERGRHYLAAGYSDPVSGARPGPDTRFELASLTETFTALLLAEAVLRGGIDLGDAVDAALPHGLKLRDSRGRALRWVDLATHRSGLPRLPDNLVSRNAADPYADYDVARLYRFIETWQPTRERGDRYEPSSLGFGLLGHALSLRAGLGYEALLSERVLRPLALDGMRLAATTGPELAQGHDGDGKPVGPRHFDVMAGAGALVGSVADVARFAQAALGLFEHSLGPAFALCMQRRGEGPAPINPVGLAWLQAPLKGRTLLVHEGVATGSSHALWLDPERRMAFVVLSNAAVPVTDMALHALDATQPLLDYRVTRQQVVALPGASLAALAGTYRANPGLALVLSVRAGTLWAQATGQGEIELFASAPRRFFARRVPLEIVFSGDAGAPDALSLNQGAMTLRFVRER